MSKTNPEGLPARSLCGEASTRTTQFTLQVGDMLTKPGDLVCVRVAICAAHGFRHSLVGATRHDP